MCSAGARDGWGKDLFGCCQRFALSGATVAVRRATLTGLGVRIQLGTETPYENESDRAER